jgi:alpha-tubulin suppressor-like RCC1 family protein
VDGTVYGSGDQNYFNNMMVQQSPVQVQGLSNIFLIECGNQHSIVMNNTGTLFSFGSNQFGQLVNFVNINC